QPPVARPHFHRIPYTTLFRSLWRQARLLVTRTTPAESSISLAPSSARNSPMMLWSPSLGTPWRNGQHCPELSSPRSEPRSFLSTMSVPSIDRKSTRLNSSHVSISYAVFCLKKKKKKHPTTRNTQRHTNRARQK